MNIKDLKHLKNLLPEKVKLLIGDEAKFQKTALLVDKPEFLEDIKILRLDLEINSPIVDLYENFSVLFTDWHKIYQKWAIKNSKKDKRLKLRINRIIRKFKCPAHLHEAIKQVVLLKAVIDYSGLVKILGKNTSFKKTTIAILPAPSTTRDEILEAWQHTKKLFKFEFISYSQKKSIKTSSNTKRNRYFYWERIAGKNYKQIAKNWGKLCPNENFTNEIHVIKGIKAYLKLLTA